MPGGCSRSSPSQSIAVLLLRHIPPLRKSPRIALEGVPSVCGALVKKQQMQFQVVKLEEVFKTAVEVDGTPVPDKPAESKSGNCQLQRPIAGVKGCNTRKRE